MTELRQLLREIGGLAYQEACFVQALLDADLNNRITFDEFVDGVQRSVQSLDNMGRQVRNLNSEVRLCEIKQRM